MSLNWNNVKPACCAKWLVLPTVYSDALSYGEQLDKFCYQLNQLIDNNNILPDFIAEMIKEYINSGAIGEVVRDIVADYILNVKYPPKGITPAVGDGSADDTAAIQGCIDYAAENGGVVYFPYGSYLTHPLTMKDGVSLFGFDRYSTKIVLKGGATKPLIGGTVADFSIANLTLDGNSGIQVNEVNVITIIGTNVLFTNLIIKDGYTLVNYVGSGGHFQISDVVFGNAVKECLFTTGNADIQCENVVFNQLSAVGGIAVMDIGTDGGFYNVKSVANCNQCIVVNGNNNKISAIVENSAIPIVDNGLQNNLEIFGVSNKEFYSSDTTKEVGGNYSKHIGGAYTKAVDGNANESVDGNFSSIVTGATTETFESLKTVNENDKVINNIGTLNENVQGDVTRVYKGDYSEEANGNVTRVYKSDYSETTNGENKKNADKFELHSTQKTLPIFFPDKTVDLYHISNENRVNVTDFGAIGDGQTNDYEAIKSAVEYCNNTGNTLYFPRGTYLINTAVSINVDCCIDFNNSVLKFSGSHTEPVFIVSQQDDYSKNVSYTLINNGGVTDPDLFNRSFTLVSPLSLGIRIGTEDEYFHKQRLVTDNNGLFVNTPYYPDVISGTYVAEHIHKQKEIITLENAVLDYSGASDTIQEFLLIQRDNVIVQNVTILEANTDLDSGSVIEVNSASMVQIKNISGLTPNQLNKVWGYVINLQFASEVEVRNVNCPSGWSSIADAFITNTLYDNIITVHVGHHYGYFGTIVHNMVRAEGISVGYGYGTFVIKSCLLNLVSADSAVINFRHDFQLTYSGDLIVDSCDIYCNNKYFIAGIMGEIITDNFKVGDFNIHLLDCSIKNASYLSYIRVSTGDKVNICADNCTFENFNIGFEGSFVSGGTKLSSIHICSCSGLPTTNYLLGFVKAFVTNSDYIVKNNQPDTTIVTSCYLTQPTSTLYLNNGVTVVTGCVISGDQKVIVQNNGRAALQNNIMVGDSRTHQDTWNTGVSA